MPFSSRRGRPKLGAPLNDKGTPELRIKREAGVTELPLDLCLKRGLITQAEYDAGAKLRWLYTQVYGVMQPKRVRLEDNGTQGVQRPDSWYKQREAQLSAVTKILETHGVRGYVYSVCVYQEFPAWLMLALSEKEKRRDKRFLRFKRGLFLLKKHWWRG